MKKLLTLAAGLTLAATTFAAAPAQLSVPGSNFPEGDVSGVRLSLLNGKTDNVTGLNLSVLGLSEVENFKGLDFGLFFGASRVTGDFTGVGLNFVNWHEGDSTGVNLGLVNYVNNMKGVNLGFVNFTTGDSLINIGAVNYGQGHTTVDIGFVNYAESTTFQLGFVNGTKNLDGVQIGLVNYAENGIFPVLPLVNFRKGL